LEICTANTVDEYPALRETYSGTISQAAAISACADTTYHVYDRYYIFQLYYSASGDNWVCDSFYGPTLGVQEFTEENSDAFHVVAYQG